MISLFGTAHISAETILVQLLVGLNIPQTAGIRRNLICQNDGAICQASEFNLEVDQTNADAEEELLQNFVNFASIVLNGVDFFLCSKSVLQNSNF